MDNNRCNFCANEETMNHLFYDYHKLKDIWLCVLDWIHVKHTPLSWDGELDWLVHHTKGKGWRSSLLKLTETLYGEWKYHNNTSYDNNVDNTKIAENILDVIVYRGWYIASLRNHIAKLMMF